MAFADLPTEIITDICELVAESSPKRYKRWAESQPEVARLSCDYANEDGILALTLVNRLFRDVTRPIVFRKVGLYLGWLEAFEYPEELMATIIRRAIRASMARPELIEFVKHFELYGYDCPHGNHMGLFSDFLIGVLEWYKTLEVLSVNIWALGLPKLLDAIVRHQTLVRTNLLHVEYYHFNAPKIDSYEKFVCNSVDIPSSRPRTQDGLVQHLSRGLSVSYLSVDSHESATWQTHSYRGLSQLFVTVEGTRTSMRTNLSDFVCRHPRLSAVKIRLNCYSRGNMEPAALDFLPIPSSTSSALMGVFVEHYKFYACALTLKPRADGWFVHTVSPTFHDLGKPIFQLLERLGKHLPGLEEIVLNYHERNATSQEVYADAFLHAFREGFNSLKFMRVPDRVFLQAHSPNKYDMQVLYSLAAACPSLEKMAIYFKKYNPSFSFWADRVLIKRDTLSGAVWFENEVGGRSWSFPAKMPEPVAEEEQKDRNESAMDG